MLLTRKVAGQYLRTKVNKWMTGVAEIAPQDTAQQLTASARCKEDPHYLKFALNKLDNKTVLRFDF